ncbi:MAG TPA: hypothetical protein GYA07_05470 [Verrucomicrobia bacterium]|nr:hypothetical protein [Verrucomicrobiota bacterium]HOB31289.1 hypothetical protein [Verrucomicrobiota bacterium]HOP96921.1 hypothetical protein [Verrucomicrobiota bacterium]HPU55669.1 hypothetical protein [Verrucomicrobiota bacterium]
MLKRLSALALAIALCGCFETRDHLTIHADGSGTVRIETRSYAPAAFVEEVSDMAEWMGGGSAIYPPITESEAEKFFPSGDFKVTVRQEKTNDAVLTVIEAAFTNINALLSSPYARAHQLMLAIEGEALVFKAVSGAEAVARLSQVKPTEEMDFASIPGLADVQNRNDEMKVEFKVTLPNEITSTGGTKDGKSASWSLDRKKIPDAAEFASQAGVSWEARCPAAGIAFKPVTPTRLGMVTFAEATHSGADGGTAVDTNRIVSSARFVPYALQVTRSVDLSGEGGSMENAAQLIGSIVLPREHAPQKWGEPKVEEAVDAKGNDLRFADADEGRMWSMRYSSFRVDDDEDEVGEGEKRAGMEERRTVSFAFRAPDWRVNEVARVKGSVELRYFSGSQLIKLTNAIPSGWIVDVTRGMEAVLGMSNQGSKVVEHPALEKIGMSLELETGMAQDGVTMLAFEVGGPAAIMDVQVYDADGKPWPTLRGQEEDSIHFGDDEEKQSCMVLVAGRPKAPLSIALLASGNATSVPIPIQVEKIPVITRKEGENKP